MFAEAVEFAMDLDDRKTGFRLPDLFDPKEPVAAIMHPVEFAGNAVQTPFPTEKSHAGIVDGVDLEHVRQEIFPGGVGHDPSVLDPMVEILLQETVPVIDNVGSGDAKPGFGMLLQLFDRGLEKFGVGDIVAFGDPDIASSCRCFAY